MKLIFKKNMKAVIFAGGKGVRFGDETKKIPKPLIKLHKFPILFYIIKHYSKYGVDKFLICAGYKYKTLINFFNKFQDFELNSKQKNTFSFYSKKNKLHVTICNTGLNTNTGGRLLKIKKHLKNEDNFYVTYGDGISNVNLHMLLSNHLKKKKILTITAARPPARYGVIDFDKKGNFKSFKEKNDNLNFWINGGFFVCNKDIFQHIKNSKSSFEKNVILRLDKKKKLNSIKHNGFWFAIDSQKDKIKFLDLLKLKKFQWLKNL
jgi:glucose-1-phosphate cytidylyltransferase